MRGSWYPSESQHERCSRWAVACLLGLLLQLPLGGLVYYSIFHSPGEIPFKSLAKEETEVVWENEPNPAPLPSPEESTRSRLAAKVEEVPRQPEVLPDLVEKGTETPAGQIVTIAPPEKEEMPDSGFAARYAQKVARQMRARAPSVDQTPKPFSKEATPPQIPRKTAGSPKAAPSKERPSQPTEPVPGPGSDEATKKEAETKGNHGTGALGEAEIEPPLEGQDPSKKYRPGTSPFASDDFLPGIKDEGDTHLLDTIPYRYAGFFERVKGQVRMHWDPNRVYSLRDPTGQLYPRRDRLTVLAVVLDGHGTVLDASVSQPSGLKFLDDEALRAMWAASPFLNPPKGLVGDDGRIRFQFGFALLTSSSDELFWRF